MEDLRIIVNDIKVTERVLPAVANKCISAPLWLGEPTRRKYEIRLKRMLKYNSAQVLEGKIIFPFLTV
jgi:hypothetical protein